MKVLIIAPHMDDEILGCGGTMVRHVEAGDFVTVCVVANRVYNHENNLDLVEREKASCQKAKKIISYQDLFFLELPDEKLDSSQIDIITPLEGVVNQYKPNIVYLPHRGDLNQDHRAVFEAVRVVCRPFAQHSPKVLRVYEVPSSTDQVSGGSEWPFLPNYYVNIEASLGLKIKAMESYTEEIKEFPHPRSSEGLRIHAQKRGMEIGLRAAEAFVILRDVW